MSFNAYCHKMQIYADREEFYDFLTVAGVGTEQELEHWSFLYEQFLLIA